MKPIGRRVLYATYTFLGGRLFDGWSIGAVSGALLAVVIGAIAGASRSRIFHYGILGATTSAATSDRCPQPYRRHAAAGKDCPRW